MITKVRIIITLLVFTLLFSTRATAQNQLSEETPSGLTAIAGSGFTYQGRLEDNSGLVNDNCDFSFGLFTDESGTEQIGELQFHENIAVSDGLFTITDLDFGWETFTGEARYLSIGVRCPAGSGNYTVLSPYQRISPTPYALALPAMRVTPGDYGPNIIGGFSANSVPNGVSAGTIGGGGVTWGYNYVFDHAGTVSGGANNQAGSDDEDFWDADGATVSGGWNNTANASIACVGGGADNAANSYAATVGGGQNNHIENFGATIGGGVNNYTSGGSTAITGGDSNAIYEGWASTISGGYTNTITTDVSVISGGYNNHIDGWGGTIGGGANNQISGINTNTIAGGYGNYVGGDANTIAGGANNQVLASDNAFIGGGLLNSTYGPFSTITGGISNTIEITGTYAVIGGGQENVISGYAATIPGGENNTAAGDFSLAAGKNAKANHKGSFVWADSRFDSDFESLRDNQFRVQASGGAQFVNGDGAWLEFLWEDLISSSSGAFLSRGGSWTNSSDVNLKENFSTVDNMAILEKLDEIPTQSWNYKSEGMEVRHIGPTAQDFYAAFGLGETDKAISTIDADGVSLAAIQGLYQIAQDQAATIDNLQVENANLEARLSALEKEKGIRSQWVGIIVCAFLALFGLISLYDKFYTRRLFERTTQAGR
jgi:hypothetical protein